MDEKQLAVIDVELFHLARCARSQMRYDDECSRAGETVAAKPILTNRVRVSSNLETFTFYPLLLFVHEVVVFIRFTKLYVLLIMYIYILYIYCFISFYSLYFQNYAYLLNYFILSVILYYHTLLYLLSFYCISKTEIEHSVSFKQERHSLFHKLFNPITTLLLVPINVNHPPHSPHSNFF